MKNRIVTLNVDVAMIIFVSHPHIHISNSQKTILQEVLGGQKES